MGKILKSVIEKKNWLLMEKNKERRKLQKYYIMIYVLTKKITG